MKDLNGNYAIQVLFYFTEVIMNIIKNTIKTEVVYDDECKKRYCLHVEWDKARERACVIMLSAGKTNGISFDHTTNYVLENLIDLNYGCADIVNLFASNDKSDSSSDNENLKVISKVVKDSDIVVFATGATYRTNSRVKERQNEVLEMLKEYEDILYCIADEDGQRFYHPLCPKVRKWNLVKFNINEIMEECND